MWIYLLVGRLSLGNKTHAAGNGHGAGQKAWRWKKRAWGGAMLKGAGGNIRLIDHPDMAVPHDYSCLPWM